MAYMHIGHIHTGICVCGYIGRVVVVWVGAYPHTFTLREGVVSLWTSVPTVGCVRRECRRALGSGARIPLFLPPMPPCPPSPFCLNCMLYRSHRPCVLIQCITTHVIQLQTCYYLLACWLLPACSLSLPSPSSACAHCLQECIRTESLRHRSDRAPQLGHPSPPAHPCFARSSRMR